MEGKLPEVRLATTPLKVVSPYEPSGDQPQAIEKLARGVEEGLRYQTLLGVTGSGKTFTMAKTIEAVQKPTLVMAPNKTLAAQLASELKELTGQEIRVTIPGHYQRGGIPCAADRLLTSRLGVAAAELIRDGKFGYMVALQNNCIVPVPLSEVAGKLKTVPPDGEVVRAARALGLCMGD